MNASIAPSTAIVGYSSEYGRGFMDGVLVGIAIGLKMAGGHPPQAQPQPVVVRPRPGAPMVAERKPFYQMTREELREYRVGKMRSQNGNSGKREDPPCPPSTGGPRPIPEPKPSEEDTQESEPVEVVAARQKAVAEKLITFRFLRIGMTRFPIRVMEPKTKLYFPGKEIQFNEEAVPFGAEKVRVESEASWDQFIEKLITTYEAQQAPQAAAWNGRQEVVYRRAAQA